MLKRIGDRLTAGLAMFGRATPELLRQGTALGAIGLVAYGAWLAYPPAGFIVGGGLLLAGTILAAR